MSLDYIYGRHPVLEALNSGARIQQIVLADGQKQSGTLAEILAAAQQSDTPVEWVSKGKMTQLVGRDANHQGVVAALPPFRYSSVDAILARAGDEPPFLLLLDGIQDVHNFGALIRTAEAAGMHGIIIPQHRAAGVTATVYKSSAGAAFHMPIAQETNMTRTIQQLQERGIWFAGLEMDGAQPYDRANLRGPLGIVLGAEGRGLSRLVAEQCDFLVRLPMQGAVSSLNASVAGGIVIYEALRQRQGGG